MAKHVVSAEALRRLPNDTQFEEYVLEKVTGSGDCYVLDFDGNAGITYDKTEFIPKPGMKIRLYCEGIGRPVRGIVIDGTPIYYRIPAEEEFHFQEEQRQRQLEKEEEFKKNKDKLDADYEALPKVYQARIDWFRNHNPKFRVDFESYELFCCKESIKITKALKTADAIDKWMKLPWEKQIKEVDVDSGHSGNTFGTATLLARVYCDSPRYVALVHGAMVGLTGCVDYGCAHNEERIRLAQPERKLYDAPYARFLALEIK